MSNALALSGCLVIAFGIIGALIYDTGRQDVKKSLLKKSVERVKHYVAIKSTPRGSDDDIIDRL